MLRTDPRRSVEQFRRQEGGPDRPGALVEIELGAAELQAPDDEALDLRHHDALTTPRARHGWARNTSRMPRARRPPNAAIENLLLPVAVRQAIVGPAADLGSYEAVASVRKVKWWPAD